MRRTAQRKLPAVRAVEADLVGLAREPVATVRLIIAESMPLVVMYDGDPFLHEGKRPGGSVAVYLKVRPYRVDDGMVIR